MNVLSRFLPFLRWFPLRAADVRADLIAGITVALVLIPQSMAYAQLAGLPAYYGLYASFLPVMIAALMGSSHQLATGPVAVASLLTASALAPLAAAGSETFTAYAILLALLVGVVQLLLGLFKLGVVVNFLSHPVIVGFTNAAALIIGLSQLNKLLGVSMGRSEHFMRDILGVLQQIGDTHLPTLLVGAGAIAIMWSLKKWVPRAPGVLIAVVITTVASATMGFEQNSNARVEQIRDEAVRTLATTYVATEEKIGRLNARIAQLNTEITQEGKSVAGGSARLAALNYQLNLLRLEIKGAEAENQARLRDLRKFHFLRITEQGETALYPVGQIPASREGDGRQWRIKRVTGDEIHLTGGGEVVGSVPSGLPIPALPKFSLDSILSLLSAAFVISLVGFMEAISIAKAIAARTKQRLDPNQELIGQGLANIAGSLTQSFPTSGSFSRSAVNIDAGAKTGLSSVFTGIVVLIALLFLTPLLYHLPQAVLAAIIMMAVSGLINFKAIAHAWHAHRHDGIAAVVTFVATLAFAPHLDSGIMLGAGLAILLYLYRTMKPRVALLGRHPDGTLRDVAVHGLETSEHLAVVRFDGQLYFANVPYFEDAILEIDARFPKARFILIVADGINQIDASGEEVIHHLVQRLRDSGVTLVFSGLKKQVIDVMLATGLHDIIGANHIFATEDMALDAISARVCATDPDADFCALKRAN